MKSKDWGEKRIVDFILNFEPISIPSRKKLKEFIQQEISLAVKEIEQELLDTIKQRDKFAEMYQKLNGPVNNRVESKKNEIIVNLDSN